jgi:hypothetical protein
MWFYCVLPNGTLFWYILAITCGLTDVHLRGTYLRVHIMRLLLLLQLMRARLPIVTRMQRMVLYKALHYVLGSQLHSDETSEWLKPVSALFQAYIVFLQLFAFDFRRSVESFSGPTALCLLYTYPFIVSYRRST